jgi:protein-S-isoprenylcysteine O-methyltransferase Ste14
MPITLTAFEWGGRVEPDRVGGGLACGAAATTAYWQVTVFAVVWVAGIVPILFYLLTHPALLRRRVRGGPLAEPDPRQRIVISLLLFCVLAVFAVSLLDLGHGWSQIPIVVVLLGDLVVAAGLVLIFVVFRVNPYAASTVNVEAGQIVISTGPYALVRHPMYSGGLLLFLGSPVGLGSWWGLVFFLPILVLIILRLDDEERYLLARLPGYRDYCARVTHRLIPFLW